MYIVHPGRKNGHRFVVDVSVTLIPYKKVNWFRAVLPGPLNGDGLKDHKIRPNENKFGPYLQKGVFAFIWLKKNIFSVIFAHNINSI